MNNTTSKPSNSTSNDTVSSLPSPSNHTADLPHLVDLASCNHQRFWKSVKRNLKSFLTCFKPAESRSKDKGKLSMDASNDSAKTRTLQSLPQNRNYYSEMNAEERDEKLKSAIVYCNDSTAQDDPHRGKLT